MNLPPGTLQVFEDFRINNKRKEIEQEIKEHIEYFKIIYALRPKLQKIYSSNFHNLNYKIIQDLERAVNSVPPVHMEKEMIQFFIKESMQLKFFFSEMYCPFGQVAKKCLYLEGVFSQTADLLPDAAFCCCVGN